MVWSTLLSRRSKTTKIVETWSCKKTTIVNKVIPSNKAISEKACPKTIDSVNSSLKSWSFCRKLVVSRLKTYIARFSLQVKCATINYPKSWKNTKSCYKPCTEPERNKTSPFKSWIRPTLPRSECLRASKFSFKCANWKTWGWSNSEKIPEIAMSYFKGSESK